MMRLANSHSSARFAFRTGGIIFSIFGAAALGGCNSDDAHHLAQDTAHIAKDAGEAAKNAQLAGRVNATLVDRKGIHFDGLHVEAKDGVVKISGHVWDANEKKIVKETAESIRGVDRVDISELKMSKSKK